MPMILSVSYDRSLLETRELLLTSNGHVVISACRLAEALEHCTNGTRFDVLLLGHSIPRCDKEMLINAFRTNFSSPILALERPGEPRVPAADLAVEPYDPVVLLDAVTKLISGGGA